MIYMSLGLKTWDFISRLKFMLQFEIDPDLKMLFMIQENNQEI